MKIKGIWLLGIVVLLAAEEGEKPKEESPPQNPKNPTIQVQKQEGIPYSFPQIPVLTPVQGFMPGGNVITPQMPQIPVLTPGMQSVPPQFPTFAPQSLPGQVGVYPLLPITSANISVFTPAAPTIMPHPGLSPLSLPFLSSPMCKQSRMQIIGGLPIASCPEAGIRVLPPSSWLLPVPVIFLPPVAGFETFSSQNLFNQLSHPASPGNAENPNIPTTPQATPK